MLMDSPGYSAWERHMVMRCAQGDRSPESVVATLERDAQVLRAWKPGGKTLVDAVRDLPSQREEASLPAFDRTADLYAQVVRCVPDDLRPQPDEHGLDVAFAEYVRPAWPRFFIPLNRYVAAKAFASWTAYQGRGVASIVRGLEAALAVVRLESSRQCRNAKRHLDADLLRDAIRSADFILNHLAVGEDLAATWSAVES
jgi:hypothetical protein